MLRQCLVPGVSISMEEWAPVDTDAADASAVQSSLNSILTSLYGAFPSPTNPTPTPTPTPTHGVVIWFVEVAVEGAPDVDDWEMTNTVVGEPAAVPECSVQPGAFLVPPGNDSPNPGDIPASWDITGTALWGTRTSCTLTATVTTTSGTVAPAATLLCPGFEDVVCPPAASPVVGLCGIPGFVQVTELNVCLFD